MRIYRKLSRSSGNADYSVALPTGAPRVKRGCRTPSGGSGRALSKEYRPMSISKPKVIRPVRAICPVCRTTAYSQGGIHPQCAESREDKDVRASSKVVPATKTKPTPRTQWTKRCPGCRMRFTCDYQPATAGTASTKTRRVAIDRQRLCFPCATSGQCMQPWQWR